MWLVGRVSRDDDKGYFARVYEFETFFSRQQFAGGGDDAGYADEVALLDACVSKGEFKRLQLLFVFAYSFGEEEVLRNHC